MACFNILLEIIARGNEVRRNLFDRYELERKKALGIAIDQYERYPGSLISGIIVKYREAEKGLLQVRRKLFDVNELLRFEAQNKGLNRFARRPGAIRHAKIKARATSEYR